MSKTDIQGKKAVGKAIKGRGTSSRPDARFLRTTRHNIDDGWGTDDNISKPLTTVTIEKPKTIISKNQSPDIPFDQSINPYRGCEHGCIYCYARPTHAYFDLSPGLDFETRLFTKPNAARLLEKELSAAGYKCTPIALGTNTDPYQPIERQYKITRQVIELFHKLDHPLTIVTKSGLVARDLDLLAPMAEKNLVKIFLSITGFDRDLIRKLEPRAAAPQRRLETVAELSNAGIPTGVMFAPVIPYINDSEMEAVLKQSANAGATSAGYVLIRLPHEIKELFTDWLSVHYPLKAGHVMDLIKDLRQGRENDPGFHSRMTGKGVYAELFKKRFFRACTKYQLNTNEKTALDTTLFKKPVLKGQQYNLWG